MSADVKSGRNYIIRAAVCAWLAAAMVGAAELLGEREVIFPEITALTVGAIAAPKHSWRVSRTRMALLIALCSVIGILIVRFSPLPKAAGLAAAYALCQVIFLLSRTSFAPLISAAALPVLMGTDTIIYPISAVSMTALTCLAQYVLERAGICQPEEFRPLPGPDGFMWGSAAVRTVVAAALAFPLISFGAQFCIAPPLLVAFTEFSNPQSKARSKPVRTVLIIAACALAGAASRYLLCTLAGFPLTVAAVISVVAALAVMRAAGQFIPPAGALGVLPMIIPEESLLVYPAEVLAGAAVFMAAALCFRRKVASGSPDVPGDPAESRESRESS